MFSAFNGIFTKGQIQEIINMSLLAAGNGKSLHEALKDSMPTHKGRIVKGAESIDRSVAKRCPECNKPLNMSMVHKDSEKYKEGYRTYMLCGASCCNNKGCGYEEYSKQLISDFIKGD